MKALPSVLPVLFVAVLLSGCVSSTEPADLAVASYPAAFLAESLAGDDLRVADLASGVELHDFEPSSRDLDQLRKSTHLVLWSEGLESWAHRAEESLGRSAPSVVEVIRMPPGEELVEAEEEEDDGHGHDHGHGHDELADPHSWMDPLAMAASAEALSEYLQAAYPEHADNVTHRAELLRQDLEALHADFEAALSGCAHDTVVTNHDAYAYLARRYGLTVVSLHGIEPGSEPSPATVRDAIRAIRDLGLPALFIEEGTDPGALKAIQDETGVQVRVLNTLETRPASGDYVSAQRQNIEQLRFALDCP